MRYTVVRSNLFDSWLKGMKDAQARARIMMRIANIQAGLLGDYKSLGNGLFEFRLHFGAGYRLYFAFREQTIILLVAGGSKDSQAKDIATARSLME